MIDTVLQHRLSIERQAQSAITLREFCVRLGVDLVVSPATISDILRGQDISLETANKVRRALGMEEYGREVVVRPGDRLIRRAERQHNRDTPADERRRRIRARIRALDGVTWDDVLEAGLRVYESERALHGGGLVVE